MNFLKTIRFLTGASLVLFLVVGFQNCGHKNVTKKPSDQRRTGSGDTKNRPLRAGISKSQLVPGEEAEIIASGGKSPYEYTVIDGSAMIVNTRTVKAGTTLGSVEVVVSDAVGNEAIVGFTIIAPAPSTDKASCTAPWGISIVHNTSVTAYQAATGATAADCQGQVRTCNDGTLSGTFTHQSCTVSGTKRSCTTPWGATLAHGASVKAYKSADASAMDTCQSETRTCNDSVLSGTFTHKTCAGGDDPQAKRCNMPNGSAQGVIANAENVRSDNDDNEGGWVDTGKRTSACHATACKSNYYMFFGTSSGDNIILHPICIHVSNAGQNAAIVSTTTSNNGIYYRVRTNFRGGGDDNFETRNVIVLNSCANGYYADAYLNENVPAIRCVKIP